MERQNQTSEETNKPKVNEFLGGFAKMNNESEDIKIETGSWEDLSIQELQRRIRLQREIQEKPDDEYLLNQLRALDTGLQMMIEKVEISR